MGFYIQDDMWEAVSALPRRQREEVITALCRLAFDGEEEDLKGPSLALFIAFRDRVLLSMKRSRSGANGGKQTPSKPEANAKQTPSKPEANAKQTPSKPEANAKQNQSDLLKSEREIESKKELPNGSSKKARPRFTPPSLDDITAYADEYAGERGWGSASDIGFEPRRFSDFYASKGWMVGKAPMKDWKAALRNWVARDRKEAGADERDQRFAAYA